MAFKLKTLTTYILTLGIALASVPFAAAKPDEGMFAPDQISKLNLPQKGLKIKPTDIYNPNGGGLSEAIVSLSIGCTAEFVSPQGLILTNHHCGIDALVAASTTEKNLLSTGYKADSRANELPAKDYSLSIPERTEDVTAKIIKGTENLTGDALAAALKKNVEDLEKAEKAKAPKGSSVRIQSLNNGFFYYLYQTKQIKDVRVVYSPPENIGEFGGDPDNFEWTRHGGDFTFLRAYVAPDGTPAEYSTNNVPYQPKKYLTLSIAGLKENDFTMVMGYPGGTTRYRESQAIDFAQNVNLPFVVSFLEAQVRGLNEIGANDEAKRIKLQADVFGLLNSIKAFKGGVTGLQRGDVVAARKAEEAKLAAWIAANPARQQKYGNLLPDFAKAYQNYYATSARDRVLRTFPGALTPAAQTPLPVFKQVFDAVQAVQKGTTLTAEKRAEISKIYADREPVSERETLKFLLQATAELPDNQKFAPAETLFNRFKGQARRSAEETFAESIAEKDFATPEAIYALYDLKADKLTEKYPNVVAFMTALAAEQSNIVARQQKFAPEANRLRKLYLEAMSEMKGTKPYPDANFTQRLTYGYVKGYSPREAEVRSPFTTLKGVIEKDTGVKPFDVPPGLKNLQRTQDFGRYGVNGTVPVDFLTNNDIIGGNSGSPVLNAYGEQVGLAFDSDYEGLGNDYFFSQPYGRTVCVDIRYVLFVTEKFGGAGWILNELTIKGAPAKARRANG